MGLKFNEMNKEQLKEELKRRGLSTIGSKADLLIMLRGAMEQEGLDPENHEFEIKEQTMVVPAKEATGGVAPTDNLELGELLAVIKQMKQDLKQQIAEQNTASQAELKQTLAEQVKQQMAEQNSNMAEQVKQIADQNSRQEKVMEQNSTKIERALADQTTKQEEMKQALKQQIMAQNTEMK